MLYHGDAIPAGVSVLGWTVYSPEVQIRTVNVPARRGATRTGGKIGGRSVVVRMVLDDSATSKRIGIIDELNNWLYTDGPQPLYLPGRESEYLLAQCDGFAAPDMEAYGTEFEVSFYCPEPEYISAQQVISDYATESGNFTVGGTLPTPVQIRQTFASAMTDPTWVLNRRVIVALAGQIPAGDILIDTAKGTITLDDVDITPQATIDSDLWMQLAPGSYSWTPPSTGGAPNISWHVRHM
jgi:predicted phage tail component-like protein